MHSQSSRKRRITQTGAQKLYKRESYECMFFLIDTCQNSVANEQIHSVGDQKPLILSSCGLLSVCVDQSYYSNDV